VRKSKLDSAPSFMFIILLLNEYVGFEHNEKHYYIWYDIYIFNRSWVDTWWQQYITHLHTNSTHNTQKGK
jgi:hypothetical protein